MGAIAEAIALYAKPLLDQTDGSFEQVEKAFALSQLCYNLALLPEQDRQNILSEMQAKTGMDDAEFEEFRASLIIPMLRRHELMFGEMRRRLSGSIFQDDPTPPPQAKTAAPAKTQPVTDRYAPCPCGSGEKYKFCCGSKRR